MGRLVPTCVWRATPELIVTLDGRFGPPHDAYVNGSQVWLREDGPGGITIEWRLHPVVGYWRPPDVGTYEVFEVTADALGLAPDAAGVVDHDAIGDQWERTRGRISIVEALLAELSAR
jgi:hypothetical protein